MKIELTWKHLTVFAAFFLGLLLALAGTMAHGTGSAALNASNVAQAMAEGKDQVTPAELAQWLVEKRQNFQLIDIRAPWQYDDYHIPSAVNIPLQQLFEDTGLKQLSRQKKIVLYGRGAGHAAQAQVLLSMKGYDALSLRDGVLGWWSEIITPTSLRPQGGSPTGYLEARQLREHFAGTATEGNSTPPGGSSAAPAPATPPPASSNPPSANPPARKLKLGRGC